jgi:HAD superfamily hydrolase (TIGR01509 family)
MNTTGYPAAVLWDMDGRLVDTESYWMQARAELAAEYKVPWGEDDALFFVGKPLPLSAAEMRSRGVTLPAPELINRLVHRVLDAIRNRIPWQPGAQELLARLAHAGIPCALVTQAYRPVAEFVAQSAHPGAFLKVVAGDDVTQGKPYPEPYVTAAAALGVRPADCVAIEDTDTGAASAEAAGMAVLVIPHLGPVPGSPSRTIRETLVGITVDDLRSLRPESLTEI